MTARVCLYVCLLIDSPHCVKYNGVCVCVHVCAYACIHKCCMYVHTVDQSCGCLSTPSFEEAILFGREGAFDGFLAVGGGSVMDTAKAANLFACYPESELMDFVAVPHGKGQPILKQLKPFICGETICLCLHMYVCVCVCLHVRVYSFGNGGQC